MRPTCNPPAAADRCAPRQDGVAGAPRRASRALRFAAAALLAAALGSAGGDDGRAGWSQLTPAQRTALAPLEWKWSTIDTTRRQKWLELAARFPSMPAEERERVQQRMTAWAALSPADRARARMEFEETRQISPAERQALWERYAALPDEERQRLARRATAPAPSGKPPAPAKSNLVNVAVAPPAPRGAVPTALQAKPGATTVPFGTRPVPPAHHQAGLPKIVATPGFVDPATLLPRRGPQGAAVHAEASVDPTRQP
jgi:hypothetical protein